MAPSGPAVGTYSSFFFLFLLQIYSTNKPSGFLYYQPFPGTILLQNLSLKAGMGKTRVPVLLFSHRSTLSAYQFPGNICPTLSHERDTKEFFVFPQNFHGQIMHGIISPKRGNYGVLLSGCH